MISVCINASDARSAERRVGRGEAYATPSAAAAVAQDGDVVTIAPGTYFDCATWRASHLTVQGAGPGVVLTDTACSGKAAFVIQGDEVTVRDLAFARIRVPDGNGAGIRAEGGRLVLERDRFVNNQVGILASDSSNGMLSVRDCEFLDNAAAGGGVADIRAGRIGRLTVQSSRLRDAGGGGSIASAASRTELSGNLIEVDDAGAAAAIVTVTNGGDLLLQDNKIVLAGRAPRLGVVLVTEDGGAPTTGIALRGNRLVNRTGAPTLLLRHWGNAAPSLSDNVLSGGDVEASSDGATLHRAKQLAHTALALLRKTASYVHQRL